MDSKCTCMYLAHGKHSIRVPFPFSDCLECLALRFLFRVTYSCPIQHTLCDNLRKACFNYVFGMKLFIALAKCLIEQKPDLFQGPTCNRTVKVNETVICGVFCFVCLFYSSEGRQCLILGKLLSRSISVSLQEKYNDHICLKMS